MGEFNFNPGQPVLEPELVVTTGDQHKLQSAARQLHDAESEKAVMSQLAGSKDLHDLTLRDVQDFLDLRRDSWEAHRRARQWTVTLGAALLALGLLCMLGATVISFAHGDFGPLRVLLTLTIFGLLVSQLRRLADIRREKFGKWYI